MTDVDQDAEAVTCRSDAADMLRIAEDRGQSGRGRVTGASSAILVDLLRRSGRIEEAQVVIDKQQETGVDEVIGGVLEYQRLLIEQGRYDPSYHRGSI